MKLTISETLTLNLPTFRRVALTLVGCGGTGSHLASSLAALQSALRQRRTGCDLAFIDPDVVEPKNVGRQLFGLADVGKPKALVLADRLASSLGAAVAASQRAFGPQDVDALVSASHDPETLSVLIDAMDDNPPARAAISDAVRRAGGRLWWLGCGNENYSGQTVLGNVVDPEQLRGCAALGLTSRLPAPPMLYPDLLRPAPAAARHSRTRPIGRPGRQQAASCAVALESGAQGLMVNRMAASWAAALLHDFLLGHLSYFACAFNLKAGGARAYTLDLATLAEVSGLSPQALREAPKAKPAYRNPGRRNGAN